MGGSARQVLVPGGIRAYIKYRQARGRFPDRHCRVVQLVAHQTLDLGVLGSNPSAAAWLPKDFQRTKKIPDRTQQPFLRHVYPLCSPQKKELSGVFRVSRRPYGVRRFFLRLRQLACCLGRGLLGASGSFLRRAECFEEGFARWSFRSLRPTAWGRDAGSLGFDPGFLDPLEELACPREKGEEKQTRGSAPNYSLMLFHQLSHRSS
jgi:hypothetical protein